jgi:hypothetical protein
MDAFANCLRPGGLLLIQNRNFDAVLAEHDRWMGPQSHSEEGSEWLFVRFYDFESDGLLRFNVLTLQRAAAGDWNQRVTSTRLWPLTRRELTAALRDAGFESIVLYGDMQGAPFNSSESPNLISIAQADRSASLHRPNPAGTRSIGRVE